jgi:type IV secretory pathway VirB10-like protein
MGAAIGDGGDQGAARDAAKRVDAARIFCPQGARLIGIYDGQVAFGQSRVLLVWTRLIMPNGHSIVLDRQPGADTAGYTSGTGNNGDIIQALRRGSSDSLNQAEQKTVQRNLNIQPTLTIRPGFPVRVIVNRDLVLEPYKG